MADPVPLQMKLVSPLGAKLRFRSMSATEEISRLFEFQVVAVSDDQNIGADKLLGKNVSISLEVAPGSWRWFHGLVVAFGIAGVDGRYFSYRFTVRPWAWLMTRSADLRIFQEESTRDIIKKLFAEYQGNVVDELSGNYKPRTFCVQYRETDFDFVSRLMEEEGMYYYWRHSEDKHELVLADAPAGHKTVPGYEEIPYFAGGRPRVELQAINSWQMQHEIQTGKFTLSDYDFEKPSTSLKTQTVESGRSHAQAKHEVYDYPGLYTEKGDGNTRAQIRLDEAAARFSRFSGEGNSPGLAAGSRFKLARHPRPDQDAEYVVLQTRIEMEQAGYATDDGHETKFICRFVAQAFADPFRPARTTHRPTVAGPQTAQVVGGGGEGEIETDKHGRVKVQFHWDREGKRDSKSSCWLRVATSWAGNGWGMISLPRIGQEVVVAFLEGDPDQPLIVGSVYNAEQKTPYELPANATVSTVKSRSKKGSASQFNELRFEDKAGNEYVLFHAQKDRLEFVEETLKSEIGKDEHRTVIGDRKEFILGEHHLQVSKDVKQRFDTKLNLSVGEDILIETTGQHSLEAATDITAKSGTAYSIDAGTDLHAKAAMNVGVDGGMNVHIKGGMNVVVEGGIQVTLKAGPSSVVLGPDGVSITGPMVKINSGGAPGSGSGASPVAPTAPDAPDEAVRPEDPLSHR